MHKTTFKHKYKIGEEVWFKGADGKPKKGIIKSIHFTELSIEVRGTADLFLHTEVYYTIEYELSKETNMCERTTLHELRIKLSKEEL